MQKEEERKIDKNFSSIFLFLKIKEMFCCVVVLHDDDADLTLHFTLFMSQLLILQKHL